MSWLIVISFIFPARKILLVNHYQSHISPDPTNFSTSDLPFLSGLLTRADRTRETRFEIFLKS